MRFVRSMHPKINQFPNAEIYDCMVSNGDNVCAPDYGARVYGLMVRVKHLQQEPAWLLSTVLYGTSVLQSCRRLYGKSCGPVKTHRNDPTRHCHRWPRELNAVRPVASCYAACTEQIYSVLARSNFGPVPNPCLKPRLLISSDLYKLA